MAEVSSERSWRFLRAVDLISGTKDTQQSRPASFAWYSAMSAFLKSSLADSGTPQATPMLAVTWIRGPSCAEDSDGFGEHRPQMLGDRGGGVASVVRLGQDNELVAAHATDHLAVSKLGRQAIGDDSQDFVARFVAQAVIDVFEVVEIDEEDGQLPLTVCASIQHEIRLLEDDDPVGQDWSMRHVVPGGRVGLRPPCGR